jgi:hypothetical protein
MPLDINFLGMEPSAALAEYARTLAQDLRQAEPTSTPIVAVPRAPAAHHQHGQPFPVRLHVHPPGNEILADREHPRDAESRADPKVALRVALTTAPRRLEERMRVRREERRRR